MRKWKYSSTILQVGTRRRLVVSFRFLKLHHCGKSLQYQLDRRLCAPKCRFGRYEEEKQNALSLVKFNAILTYCRSSQCRNS
jgi:hypothetical protein